MDETLKPVATSEGSTLTPRDRDALNSVESALHAVSCFGNCRQELAAFSAMRSVIRDILGDSDPTFHLSLLDDAVWGRY